MKKRILSWVLMLSMLMAFVPCVVQAQTNIKLGDYVQMGTYYDEPILWRCVDIDENGPLMLADKIICLKAFDAKTSENSTTGSHSRRKYYESYGSNYWADSNIRSWLNSTAAAGEVEWLCGNPPSESYVQEGYNDYADEAGFLTNFTQSERNTMKEVRQKSILSYPEIDAGMATTGTEKHVWGMRITSVVANYDSAYAEYVTDKMFLLDVKQVNAVYNNGSVLGDDYYIGEPTAQCVKHSELIHSSLSTGKKWDYWLRSPVSPDYSVYRVNSTGSLYHTADAYHGGSGVRPAFYLADNTSFTYGDGTENNPYTVDGDSSSSDIKLAITPSEWAANAINQAIELGLIPKELQSDWQTPITRLDFCKLAYTLYTKLRNGAVVMSADNKFNDIGNLSEDDNYMIGTVAGLGIVSGYEDGTFRPYNEITRQEAATMLMRTAKALDTDGLIVNLEIIADFVDCTDTADWAMEGIKYCYSSGIMSGVDEQHEVFGNPKVTFDPYGTYTREQAMVTFYRLYDKLTPIESYSHGTGVATQTGYAATINQYMEAIEDYQTALEDTVSIEKKEQELKQTMKAAMKEHWQLTPNNNVPDAVYEALYMFTSELDDFKVISKNYNWSKSKDVITGSLELTATTLSNIGNGKYKYLVDGTVITIDATTVGKNGFGTVEWDNNNVVLSSNPKEVLDTFKSLITQSLDLIKDIYSDEFKDIAQKLTGFKSVDDFLQKKLSAALNRKAIKLGLGDINKIAGNIKNIYDLSVSIQNSENAEDLLKQMKKLSEIDLNKDETITNLAVKEAFDNLEAAKEKLIKEAEVYVYGTEISE
jgi:hypothetical protein